MEYKFNNYNEMLENSAKLFGKKKAIFQDLEAKTYFEFKRQIDQISSFLSKNGVNFGDRVAMFVKNGEEFITTFFGITCSSACAVAINTFLKNDEVKYILNDCNPKILFASVDLKDELTGILAQTTIEKVVWIGKFSSFSIENIALECKQNEDFEAMQFEEKLEEEYEEEIERQELKLIQNEEKNDEFEAINSVANANLKEIKKFSSYDENLQDAKILIKQDKNSNIEHFIFSDIIAQNEKFELKLAPNLDDISHIVYTSGTTGRPKGAMLTYRNIFSNVQLCAKRMSLTSKDRFIVYLPMFHSFTLTIMVILPIYLGATLVVVKSVFPFSNVLKQVLLRKVTIFLGIPSIFTALAKAKIPWYFRILNRVRIFISGSSPLSEATIGAFHKKFPRAAILEGYGLSECSPVVSVNPPKKEKVLSVGPALDEYQIKIVDENMMEVINGEVGEVIVKGDSVMKGYYNNPSETNLTIINGWLKTGDLGKLDSQGYLYIVDRLKDLIISKGINIYPREIEEVILKFSQVGAVAVIGVKDGKKEDEEVLAFIELKEGEKLDAKELEKYLKEHLANYKIPKYIYFTDQLPKNATGKVLKRVLKEQFLNKHKKEG